jgi:hypothetical protein
VVVPFYNIGDEENIVCLHGFEYMQEESVIYKKKDNSKVILSKPSETMPPKKALKIEEFVSTENILETASKWKAWKKR